MEVKLCAGSQNCYSIFKYDVVCNALLRVRRFLSCLCLFSNMFKFNSLLNNVRNKIKLYCVLLISFQ